MTVKAIDAARWFIRKNYDSPRNTFDGNMKLQKLLYFSQLVHLAKHDSPLFGEKILAFKNGSVIEEVRHHYYYRNNTFVRDSNEGSLDFTQDQINTFKLVEDVFGGLSAKDLSDLNHLHESWKDSYERSAGNDGFHYKEDAVISLDQMKENEVETIQEIVEAYEQNTGNEDFEIVNGIKFFYDSDKIKLTADLLEMLESFNGPDSAYTIYKDEDEGLVIY